jgi:hypothetical protein
MIVNPEITSNEKSLFYLRGGGGYFTIVNPEITSNEIALFYLRGAILLACRNHFRGDLGP